MKIRNILAGVGVVAGLSVIAGLTDFGPTERGCGTFDTVGTIDKESRNYFFEPIMIRAGAKHRSDYSIEGESETVGHLSKGENYCFQYTLPALSGPTGLRNVHPESRSNWEKFINGSDSPRSK